MSAVPDALRVDVQYSSATNDWPTLRDAVLAAEAAGVGTTWVFDHFDGSVLGGDRPLLECFTLLGALAAVTRTIGLGPLVANVANRHPSVLAAAASSVERIAGDRLVLGLGAGAAPGSRWAAEHDRRGIPLQAAIADRHAAVVRQVEVLRAEGVRARVVVGVNSVALARIAGRVADGVNVRLDHPRAGVFVDAAREAADGRPFEVSAWTDRTPEEAASASARLGLARLVLTRTGPLPRAG